MDNFGSVNNEPGKAYFHLPGLFEFFEFYKVFLPLYREHREYFYDWCEIASIYGAPSDCTWNGGRIENSDADPKEVFDFLNEYGISGCFTFSNSMLTPEYLRDEKCNELCKLASGYGPKQNGAIVTMDMILLKLTISYPNLYRVSSTTKVLTDFNALKFDLDRGVYDLVVADFRLNKSFDRLSSLTKEEKDKVVFLCNECCAFDCKERKECYEYVSRLNLGDESNPHICASNRAGSGYRFSLAMENPGFIGISDIKDVYLPMGFSHFKIEGRGLGSALLLEFLLFYLTKPEKQIYVREALYLDNMLDLF